MEDCKPCPLTPKTTKERADSLAEKILEWLDIAKRTKTTVTADSISEGIERVLKVEQKITRHACAEISQKTWSDHMNRESVNMNDLCSDIHAAIMNTKAI